MYYIGSISKYPQRVAKRNHKNVKVENLKHFIMNMHYELKCIILKVLPIAVISGEHTNLGNDVAIINLGK